MKRFMFLIHQGPDTWLIVGSSIGQAVFKWRDKAGYPDGAKVFGRPDKIIYYKY